MLEKVRLNHLGELEARKRGEKKRDENASRVIAIKRAPCGSSSNAWQSLSRSWSFRQQQLAARNLAFALGFILLSPKCEIFVESLYLCV